MSTIRIDTNGERIFAISDRFSDRDRIGLVPGAKWREARGHWELPLTWEKISIPSML